jgi:hypothetical protein
VTGDGVKEFFDAVQASRDEYEKWVTCQSQLHLLINFSEYLPELEKARTARDKSLQAIKDESMNRLMKDLVVDQKNNPALAETWETAEDDDDDDDMNIIDRCQRCFFLFRHS